MTSLTSTSLIRFPFNSVPSSFFITLFKSLLVANSRVLKEMSGYNHFLNLRTPWLRGCKYLRDTFWSIDTAIHKWTYWVTKTMVSIKYYTALYNGLNATRAERWMLSSVLVSSSVCSPQAGESLEKAFSRSYLQRKKKGEIKAKRVLDNLRMSKVQEISTSVAIVCHPFERLNILQNDFAIIRLRARKDYEKLFKETEYKYKTTKKKKKRWQVGRMPN